MVDKTTSDLHEYLRQHLYWRAGMVSQPSLASLRESEWSNHFETLMRNRLIMGAWRYGCLGQPGKPHYDRIASMRKRLEAYEQDPNAEHLVDIANLCLCEFVEGQNYFKSLDGSEAVNATQREEQ